MSTGADFYIGRGANAEWIGSIRQDGYPEGIDARVLRCKSVETFRHAVADFIKDIGRLPEDGWPWTWEDSRMTDYSYAFDAATVHASCFGNAWFDPKKRCIKMDATTPGAVFPTMLQGEELEESRAMWSKFFRGVPGVFSCCAGRPAE